MENTKLISNFEKCLDSADRAIGRVWAAIEETQTHLKRKDLECAYAAAFEAAAHSEKLTVICRQMPAFSGHPRANTMIDDAILKNFPVEIGFTSEGWFCVRLPALLPKKNRGSVAYISDPLYPAMMRFWRGKTSVRYPDCVVIFRHVYDRDRPERQYRDHDNIELNRVLDVIALYVMPDDSPVRCRHYYCSASGSKERTEIYIVPRVDFMYWLGHEDSIPDRGVKLFENWD